MCIQVLVQRYSLVIDMWQRAVALQPVLETRFSYDSCTVLRKIVPENTVFILQWILFTIQNKSWHVVHDSTVPWMCPLVYIPLPHIEHVSCVFQCMTQFFQLTPIFLSTWPPISRYQLYNCTLLRVSRLDTRILLKLYREFEINNIQNGNEH